MIRSTRTPESCLIKSLKAALPKLENTCLYQNQTYNKIFIHYICQTTSQNQTKILK